MLKISDFFSELNLKKDAQVADFGCGNGKYSKLISSIVPEGKVFAIDLTQEKLEYLEEELLKEKIINIIPVWGNIEDLNGTRLRDDSIDVVIMSDTFYLLQHKKTCILEIKRILKKRGKILFLDWHKHLGESTLHKNLVLDEQDVAQMFAESGFGVYPLIHKGSHQFVLIMEKR